ncbi:DUF2341 domain-containing protein, partial [Patescibacteria group bacterium]|nr:DUF2341 domain-containing protein [Patescibacteria group bacterium]
MIKKVKKVLNRLENLKLINLLTIFALLSVAVGLIFLLKKPVKEISAAWFNDNWLYRKAVEITNSGSAISSERKIKIDVDTAALITAGKMQSDCDDIRFTDNNGKLLDYFIDTNEADCNNASTDFYVKLSQILTGGQMVYIYYGNPSASSVRSNDFFAPDTIGIGLKGYWKMDEASANTCPGGANDSCDSATINDG